MVSFFRTNFDKISSQCITNHCIVLDLDETLVHTYEDIEDISKLGLLTNPNYHDIRERLYTLSLEDVTDRKGAGIRVKMWGITRPHVKEFLTFCFSYFKIVAVWSAGRTKYVDAIVEILFRDIAKPHVTFSWKDCETNGENLVSKPLTKMINSVPELNKYMNLNNTFILDDRLSNFAKNSNNGVLIPYYDPALNIMAMRRNEESLPQFMSWLNTDEVKNAKDIRDVKKNRIWSLTASYYGPSSPRSLVSIPKIEEQLNLFYKTKLII